MYPQVLWGKRRVFTLSMDHLNVGKKRIGRASRTAPGKGQLHNFANCPTRFEIKSSVLRGWEEGSNTRDPLPARPLNLRGSRRRGPAPRGASRAGKQFSLTDLPVFDFDRIRVGRLHFHLHLGHEGAGPGPWGKRRSGKPDSKRGNPGTYEDSGRHMGLLPRVASGPSLPVALRWPSRACAATNSYSGFSRMSVPVGRTSLVPLF